MDPAVSENIFKSYLKWQINPQLQLVCWCVDKSKTLVRQLTEENINFLKYNIFFPQVIGECSN